MLDRVLFLLQYDVAERLRKSPHPEVARSADAAAEAYINMVKDGLIPFTYPQAKWIDDVLERVKQDPKRAEILARTQCCMPTKLGWYWIRRGQGRWRIVYLWSYRGELGYEDECTDEFETVEEACSRGARFVGPLDPLV